MYSHTKKVGSLGRYGARIGRKIRNEIRKIEDETRRSLKCPNCGKMGLKRPAAGIWVCKSCNISFSGGAYKPKTIKKIEEAA